MSKYQIIEKFGKKQKEGITLSTSSTDTMEKCPRQYYLQYIAKIKVPDDQTALVFGRMIHIIIENYHGGGDEEIKGLFNLFQRDDVKLREKYWDILTPEYKGKILKTIHNVRYYLKNRYVKSVGIKHEEQFDLYDIDEVDGKHIHAQGKIDGLYQLENNVFITDFKTGKKKKDHSKQLGFYLYMLNKAGENKITKAQGEIVNLCLEDQRGFDDVLEYYNLEEFDIIRAENRIKTAITTLKKNGIQLESGDNWIKKPQRLCNWCKYFRSGHCNGK